LFAGVDVNDNKNHDDCIPVITTEEHLATRWTEQQ